MIGITVLNFRFISSSDGLPYSGKIWQALNLANWLSVGISEV